MSKNPSINPLCETPHTLSTSIYRKYSKIRKCKVRKLASKCSKNSIYWATLKFGKASNFGKGGSPGYCLMAIYTSGTVLDNRTCTWRKFGSAWRCRLTLRLQLSCHGNSLPVRSNELFSSTRVPHLFADVISADNARYCDKESASGGHLLYRMDLNFRGTKLSRFSRFDSHPRKFSPAKI